MSVTTTTHLNFRGQARAALERYQRAFGGQLIVMTYRDAGVTTEGPAADEVMWGQVEAENGFRVMAFDVPAERPFERGEAPFFVSVRGSDADEVHRYWDALTEGSTVVVPFGPAPWSPAYGMLTDAFGVTWVIDVAHAW